MPPRLPMGRLLGAYGLAISFSASEGLTAGLISPYLASVGFAPAAIGALVATASVASLLSRLPAGFIYRGSRARWLLVVALLGQGAVTLAYPFLTAALPVGVARAINGAAAGMGTTVNFALFMELLPSTGTGRLRAVGVYLACQSAGYAVGSFLSGVAFDRLGWQPAFWLAALFPLLGLLLPRTPPAPAAPSARADAPPPSAGAPTGTAGAPAARAAGSPPAPASAGAATAAQVPSAPAPVGRTPGAARPRWAARIRPYLVPDVATMIVLAFAMIFLFQLVHTFFPLFALGIGFSLTQVGALRGLQSLANAVTRPFTGELSRAFGYRLIGHVGLTLSVLLSAALPVFGVFEVYTVVFLTLGLVRGAALVSNSLSAVEIVERRKLPRGIISGLLNAAQDLGAILGPILGGVVAAAWGVPAALYALPLAVGVLYFACVAAMALQRAPGTASRQPRAS